MRIICDVRNLNQEVPEVGRQYCNDFVTKSLYFFAGLMLFSTVPFKEKTQIDWFTRGTD